MPRHGLPYASRSHLGWTEGRPTTLSVQHGDVEFWRPRPPPLDVAAAGAQKPSPGQAGASAAERWRSAVDAAKKPAAAQRAIGSEELAGKAQVRKTLQEVCAALGRTEEDVGRVVALLEEEWLCDPHTLQGLSEEGWRQLRVPLALKEELRRRVHSARHPPAAPGSRAGEKGAASGKAAAAAAVQDGAGSQPEKESHEDEVLRKVRLQFQRRSQNFQGDKGGGGLRGLGKRFASMDDDNNKKLSREEFGKAVHELSLEGVSDDDLDVLWLKLDADGSGFASFDEVVELLGAALNVRRKHAVESLFKLLDMDRNGELTPEDVRMRYGLSQVQGRLRPGTDEEHILNCFEHFRKVVGARVPGHIRKDEFVKYYEKLGRNIDNDEHFVEMLTKAWQLPEGWLTQFPPPPPKKVAKAAPKADEAAAMDGTVRSTVRSGAAAQPTITRQNTRGKNAHTWEFG